MSIQLISLAELKIFLEEDGTDFDNLLLPIIQEVSAQIESHLNRKLKEVARTEYFSGGRSFYQLRAFPINTSPAPVILVDDDTQVVDSDYYINHEHGFIEFLQDTPNWRPKIVKITWTGGYVETTSVLAVGDDLKGACKQQCAHLFRRRDDLGLTNTSTPDGTISAQSGIDLLPNVKKVLRDHRLLGDTI